MSKIFKRPMFRKGGQVMDGVMSLAAPRKQYFDGGDTGISPELAEKYPELTGGYQKYYDFYRDVAQQDMGQAKSDILSNLLIRGGLGLVSGEGAGKGTLGGLATAFRGPTEQAMGELQKLKGTEQQVKSAALGSAIEAEQSRLEREADLKAALAKKGYESGSLAGRREALREQYMKEIGATYDEGVIYSEKIIQLEDAGLLKDYIGAKNTAAIEALETAGNIPEGTIIYDTDNKVNKIFKDGVFVILGSEEE